MNDIVERLRNSRCPPDGGCNNLPVCACALMDDAIAEIRKLRAEKALMDLMLRQKQTSSLRPPSGCPRPETCATLTEAMQERRPRNSTHKGNKR